jgi:K(+)-stimulated pyrophosphate-energized sodium pump
LCNRSSGRQSHEGGEASLILPDLAAVDFHGISSRTLLVGGLGVCALGLLFGLMTFTQLKGLPVHASMLEVSELIYETCKTYLITQGKFILILWVFIAFIISAYYGWLNPIPGKSTAVTLPIILIFSLIGIAGSYGVAWFGIRVNTFANSRAAFASLRGKPFPIYAIPLRAGHEHRHAAHQRRAAADALYSVVHPARLRRPVLHRLRHRRVAWAAALRIAGGIFTKIADIGSDLMKIVFNIKEDDAGTPGVIADCTGDNAGDSVGPSADGFETYGVTGVALITFIVLAVRGEAVQVSCWCGSS